MNSLNINIIIDNAIARIQDGKNKFSCLALGNSTLRACHLCLFTPDDTSITYANIKNNYNNFLRFYKNYTAKDMFLGLEISSSKRIQLLNEFKIYINDYIVDINKPIDSDVNELLKKHIPSSPTGFNFNKSNNSK